MTQSTSPEIALTSMATRKRICLTSKSSHVGKPQLLVIAAACNLQLMLHAGPAWGKAPFHVVADDPAEGDMELCFFDSADQAGVLGYHDETPDGRPYARVFVEPVLAAGGSIYDPNDGGNTVSAVASHEVLEMWGDPYCNLWAQDKNGDCWAMELADQVEGDAYLIRVNGRYGQDVPVSNFLGPRAFDVDAGPGDYLDYMGILEAPFTIAPNGYAIKMTGGSVTAVWGEKGPVAWKKATKLSPAARTYKRGVRL